MYACGTSTIEHSSQCEMDEDILSAHWYKFSIVDEESVFEVLCHKSTFTDIHIFKAQGMLHLRDELSWSWCLLLLFAHAHFLKVHAIPSLSYTDNSFATSISVFIAFPNSSKLFTLDWCFKIPHIDCTRMENGTFA